jgi:hypothetical protein
MNGIEIFNELSFLTLIYFSFLFTDFVPDLNLRYSMGWIFLGITALNLFVNWMMLFQFLASILYNKIKAKYMQVKARREAKKAMTIV